MLDCVCKRRQFLFSFPFGLSESRWGWRLVEIVMEKMGKYLLAALLFDDSLRNLCGRWGLLLKIAIKGIKYQVCRKVLLFYTLKILRRGFAK